MMNSMIKKCSWFTADAGLLALRIGVAAIFIFNGYMKVSNLSGTAAMFGAMGFAAFWAYLVSFVELLGGIAMLIGIYTRFFAALLTITMIVAIYVVHSDLMMVMTPFSVFWSVLALTFAGAGRFSLDRKLCKEHAEVAAPAAAAPMQ